MRLSRSSRCTLSSEFPSGLELSKEEQALPKSNNIRGAHQSGGFVHRQYRHRPSVEQLERRNLLSVLAAAPDFHRPPPGMSPYTPAQILHAYGFDQLSLAQPGQGQTIAIV